MNKAADTSPAWKNYSVYAALACIFLYVLIRSSLIDITHDEAYSFYNMKKFWYAEALCTGNTHWINSAAIKLAILFNAENLLAIRWLSVCSALVICMVVLSWIRSVPKFSDRILIFAVLLCNPYILDYLSIARGYAAGMMCEFLALFLLAKNAAHKKSVPDFKMLFIAGMSPLANFSYIYFFLCFCFIYFFRYYFTQKAFLKSGRFYRDLLFSISIAALVARAFLFITRCSNDVVGAGTNDWREFFHVFADGLIYFKFSAGFNTLTFFGALSFAFSLTAALNGLIKGKQQHLYYYSSLLFLLITLVIIINHFVFHLVYPYYRSAVFIFPVAAVSSACFIVELNNRLKIISSIIATLLVLNFIFSANFKWVLDFRIQCNLRESFNYVETSGSKHTGISPELYGGYRNYHQMTWKHYYDFFGESINTNLPKGLSRDTAFLSRFDHLILFPPYDLSYYRNNSFKLEGLMLYPETGTLVVKVRK